MNQARMDDVDSMIRCLDNFGGAMANSAYRDAADLMEELRDEVNRITPKQLTTAKELESRISDIIFSTRNKGCSETSKAIMNLLKEMELVSDD